MGKFKSKGKALTLTALIASTAIVAYANQDRLNKAEVDNIDTAKLIVDKIDKDTVKVSVENINNAAKAFQLSLKVEGNAQFETENIKWLTNLDNENKVVDDTILNEIAVSDDKKTIDIIVSGENELPREGSTIDIFEIDLKEVEGGDSASFEISPNAVLGKSTFKSVDVNNKSLEEADMAGKSGELKFNTAPTIELKESVTAPSGEEVVIDKKNSVIIISEGYRFDAKDFIIVADEEQGDIGVESVVVKDENGKVVSGVEDKLSSGNHVRTYVVTDNEGESATLTVDVNVIPEIWKTEPTLTGVPRSDVLIYTGDVFDIFRPDGKTSIEAKDAKENGLEVKVTGEFNLNVAGTYVITYTATDRYDNTISKAFNLVVKEDTKPVIEGVEDITINVNEEFDPLAGVEGRDLEDDTITKKDIVVTGTVNTTLPGKYKLVYRLSDARNTTTKERTVTVNGAPSISGDFSPIIIKNGQSISDEEIVAGITATDEDGDLTANLIVDKSKLNTAVDGIYEVKIEAMDSRNLVSEKYRNVIVTSASIVELPDSGDGYTEGSPIKKQIVEAGAIENINRELSSLTKDNEVKVSKNTLGNIVKYEVRVIPNKVPFVNANAEYFIEFIVPKAINDITGGIVVTQYEGVKISSIVLKGYKGEIKVGEKIELTAEIGPDNAENKELLWLASNNEVVSISQSEDSHSATINALKEGTATVRVVAVDGSGIYEEVVVQVGKQPEVDTKAPVFDYTGSTEIFLINGRDFKIPDITASDNVDTGIEVKRVIKYKNGSDESYIDTIDTTIAGKYEIIYTAEDKSGNKAELIIKVTIGEVIPNVEIGSGDGSETSPIKINIPTEVSGLNSLLEAIEKKGYKPVIVGKPIINNVENKITYNLKMYMNENFFEKFLNLNKNKEVYYMELTVKNSDEFKVILNELQKEGFTNKAPEINAKDIRIKVGESFNPLSNVTATDSEDGDITSKIEIVENTIDTTKAGTYKVTYSVIDSLGQKVTKEITVVVEAKDSGSNEGETGTGGTGSNGGENSNGGEIEGNQGLDNGGNEVDLPQTGGKPMLIFGLLSGIIAAAVGLLLKTNNKNNFY